jgi:hypothetical protein
MVTAFLGEVFLLFVILHQLLDGSDVNPVHLPLSFLGDLGVQYVAKKEHVG